MLNTKTQEQKYCLSFYWQNKKCINTPNAAKSQQWCICRYLVAQCLLGKQHGKITKICRIIPTLSFCSQNIVLRDIVYHQEMEVMDEKIFSLMNSEIIKITQLQIGKSSCRSQSFSRRNSIQSLNGYIKTRAMFKILSV